MRRAERRAPALAVAGLLWVMGLEGLAAQPAAVAPVSPPPASTPLPAAGAAPFDVLEFEIEGNTVLPVADIERAVTPFLGPAGGMAQVDAARTALERAYQQAGYLTVFVDVPEQQVQDGVVRLVVLQGRVDRLRVLGSRYFSQGFIRDTVPELAEGNTPNFNLVQRQLADLNRTDERSVQPVLRPGRLPGTVEVDLQVQDRLPAEASVELHNKHAAGTSETRLAATGRYNNLWQRGHSIGITLSTAPQQPRESQLLVLNYGVPLSAEANLALYAVASDSLTEPLTAVSVAGKGLSLGLRYLRTLPGLDGFAQSLSLGLDFKDFQTQVGSGSGAAASKLLTPLRYLPFTLGHNAQWTGPGSSTSLNNQIVFAQHWLLARSVRCTDAGAADQFACSASSTDGSFAYWRADWRHSRPLPLPAAGQVVLRLSGQFSPEPLVGNERFVLGGADSVRGYLEAEASGDRGLLASAEWRSPNLGGAKGWAGLHSLSELVAYGFVDAGQTQVLNALAGQARHTQLRGAGLGLQWRLGRLGGAAGSAAAAAGGHGLGGAQSGTLNGAIDLAWPLVSSPASPANQPRLHVRLAYTL